MEEKTLNNKPLQRRHAGIWCTECKRFANTHTPCKVSCKSPVFYATSGSIQKEHNDCEKCDSSLQRSSEFVFWESLCGVHKIDYLLFWKKLTASERKEFRFMKVPPEAEAELDLGPIPTLTRGIANGKNSVEE